MKTKKSESLQIVFLGLQHAFTMFASVVLVPKLLGIDISVAIFMAGVETLIFHFFTKRKVPVFLGSSFEFLPPLLAASAIYGMNYALGGVVICGVVYLLAGLVAFLFGTEKIIRLFPPVITGSISIAVGLSLASHAISLARNNWILAVIAFLIVAWINVNRKGFVKIFSIVISIGICYLVSIILTVTGQVHVVDLSAIMDAAWFGIPKFTIAKFNIGATLIVLPYTMCAIVDHIGDIVVTGAICKKDFTSDPGIHRTLIGDGVAASASAFFGGPPNATYSENIGVLALTRNYNPKTLRVAAIIAILLGFIPKVSAFIASIPDCIIGGVSIILFGTISAMGINQFIENKVNFGKSRNVIITATMLILSLGGAAISADIKNISFSIEGIGLAAIVGIILNLIFPQSTTMKEEKESNNINVEENLFVMIPKSERYKVAGFFDLNVKGEEYAELLGSLTDALCNVVLRNDEQGEDTVIVPILRAGESMSVVVEKRLPKAEVAKISMRRNLRTLKPFVAWDEFEKIQQPEDKRMIITDPALATGGSILKTIERAIIHGFKEGNIIILAMFGGEGGIEKVISTYPKVKIYLAHMADGIRDDGYLLPYNGDTGDRLYGVRENEYII